MPKGCAQDMLNELLDLRASDEYLAAIDSMGTVVFADRALLDFFGRLPSDVGQVNVGEILKGPELAWLAHAVGRMFADGPAFEGHVFKARARTGTRVPFQLTLTRLDRPDGCVFVVAMLRPWAS